MLLEGKYSIQRYSMREPETSIFPNSMLFHDFCVELPAIEWRKLRQGEGRQFIKSINQVYSFRTLSLSLSVHFSAISANFLGRNTIEPE